MTTKQELFKQLDDFISELGCAEMRVDELLRDIDRGDFTEQLSVEIRDDAEQIANDLISSARTFSARIKKMTNKSRGAAGAARRQAA